MAEHCGQSDMPASHSCCQAPTRPESALVKGQVKLPSKNTIAAVAAAMQIHGPSDAAVPVRVLAFCESPPDQLPSHSSSILRI
jgi:hypothetical protein